MQCVYFMRVGTFKGITACTCLNINMRRSITAFYRITKWKLDMTVIKVNVCSCRTFLSHWVFNIFTLKKLKIIIINVWRSYDIQVRREKALGDVRSLIALAVLLHITDRSSCAASGQTHLSSLQRKHHVGTLLCCQVCSLPRVVFLSVGHHNKRNWRATCKRYPRLYFPVKITEFVWKSSAFKNCRVLL